MQIQEYVSLKPYNTFGIDVPARYYTELRDEAALADLSESSYAATVPRVIGGGSNILLTGPVEGLVIRNCIRGISVLDQNDDHVWLEVKAGEVWHDLVMHAIRQDLGGLENLSLIPGCVGAAPMQNIGAYGVEVKDTIAEVVAWHWDQRRFITLKNADCRFGYRDSIFKQELRDKVLITSVAFRLNRIHCINTSYGAIRQELDAMGVAEPDIKSVSDAVIAIRSSKLPDPARIGNAGSFFKNPTISLEQFGELQRNYPFMPSYPVDQHTVKVPAGWLIEQAGWKGFRVNGAGVHEKQALVLVNYGTASGAEVFELSSRIMASIREKFGIALEREVNIW